MIERIDAMPDGTLGWRLSGQLTLEDYRVIMDPIYEVLKRDGELRLLFEIEGDFKAHDPKVFWADLKADYEVTVKHRENVKRTAIVTDIDWLKRWLTMAAWLAPGEAKRFEPEELEAAKAWVAG